MGRHATCRHESIGQPAVRASNTQPATCQLSPRRTHIQLPPPPTCSARSTACCTLAMSSTRVSACRHGTAQRSTAPHNRTQGTRASAPSAALEAGSSSSSLAATCSLPEQQGQQWIISDKQICPFGGKSAHLDK